MVGEGGWDGWCGQERYDEAVRLLMVAGYMHVSVDGANLNK